MSAKKLWQGLRSVVACAKGGIAIGSGGRVQPIGAASTQEVINKAKQEGALRAKRDFKVGSQDYAGVGPPHIKRLSGLDLDVTITPVFSTPRSPRLWQRRGQKLCRFGMS